MGMSNFAKTEYAVDRYSDSGHLGDYFRTGYYNQKLLHI
jgi:hypothetical protein